MTASVVVRKCTTDAREPPLYIQQQTLCNPIDHRSDLKGGRFAANAQAQLGHWIRSSYVLIHEAYAGGHVHSSKVIETPYRLHGYQRSSRLVRRLVGRLTSAAHACGVLEAELRA